MGSQFMGGPRKTLFFYFLKIFTYFIYLFLAVSGLSCGTWALHCGMLTSLSLVVACRFSLSS